MLHNSANVMARQKEEENIPDYPLFTRKAATDVSYLACARDMLGAKNIYPAFATHNANTIGVIKAMAGDTEFEFQRLHGMGEALHELRQRSLVHAAGEAGIGDQVGETDRARGIDRRRLELGRDLASAQWALGEVDQADALLRDIVDAAADRWGGLPTRRGKVVWLCGDVCLADYAAGRADEERKHGLVARRPPRAARAPSKWPSSRLTCRPRGHAWRRWPTRGSAEGDR